MQTDYEIVKYTPEFKSQVLELQTHLWGSDLAVNAAHLEWKYERNPYLESPFIYLALYNGRTVGMRGMYGAQWQGGHPCQTWVGLCAGDLVIAPDHRNRRLYTEITRTALNDLADMGYQYVFSLSAGPVTYLGSLAMDWRSVGAIHTMQRKGDLATLEGFHRLHPGRIQRRHRAAAHVSLGPSPRPEAMAELVERIGHDGRIRHVRDPQYFAWRFQNPLSRYQFCFWEDTRMEGYLVLEQRLARLGRPKVSIVDWEATDVQVRADLLKAVTRGGNFEDLTIWSEALPDEAKRLLQNHGFTQLHETGRIAQHRPTVLVRPTHDAMLAADWVLANRRLLDIENWDLRMIYSDNY